MLAGWADDKDVMNAAAEVIFPWRESYSVRVPEIDTQHKELIRLINDLHSAMLEGKAKTILSGLIGELTRYTQKHFVFEESWMKRMGYSRVAAHQIEHGRLIQQVQELRDKVESGRITVTIEVMQFLKDWLANHILVQDQAYAREVLK